MLGGCSNILFQPGTAKSSASGNQDYPIICLEGVGAGQLIDQGDMLVEEQSGGEQFSSLFRLESKSDINPAMMKDQSILFYLVILVIVISLTGFVVPSSADLWGMGTTKGFLPGLLMGYLAPFKFIVSLFTDYLTIYAIDNNGDWYNFGFILGIGGFSGGVFRARSFCRS